MSRIRDHPCTSFFVKFCSELLKRDNAIALLYIARRIGTLLNPFSFLIFASMSLLFCTGQAPGSGLALCTVFISPFAQCKQTLGFSVVAIMAMEEGFLFHGGRREYLVQDRHRAEFELSRLRASQAHPTSCKCIYLPLMLHAMRTTVITTFYSLRSIVQSSIYCLSISFLHSIITQPQTQQPSGSPPSLCYIYFNYIRRPVFSNG